MRLLLVILFSVVLAGCGEPDPKYQFELMLAKPMPTSVGSLRFDRDIMGADPTYHLSFSASAQDMAAIVASKKFEVVSEADTPIGGYHPAWWRLDELGTNRTFYTLKKERSVEYFWVSVPGTNAYYLFLGL